MTELADPTLYQDLDDVPKLTPVAASERAAASQSHAKSAPSLAGVLAVTRRAAAPAVQRGPRLCDGGEADPGNLPRPSPAEKAAPAASENGHQDGGRIKISRIKIGGSTKGILAAIGFFAGLAVVAGAAALLTFPQAARLAHLSHGQITWLVPVVALAAAYTAAVALRAAWRLLAAHPAADLLTLVAAAVATTTAATGMWAFFERYVPNLDVGGRAFVFAFLEIFTFAEGLRARDSMLHRGSRGVDGPAMWAGAVASALLASMASTSVAEGLFRLVPPLAAAWMWERSLVAQARRRSETRQRRINWITPERILVRLRLAEPSGRTVEDVAARHHIYQTALAVERVAVLQHANASVRKISRARRRLSTAKRRAVERADLAISQPRQKELLRTIAVLVGDDDLISIAGTPLWADLVRGDGAGKGTAANDTIKPDRRPEPPPVRPQRPQRPRPDRTIPPEDAGPYGELVAQLTEALRNGSASAAAAALSGRADNKEFVRWLGQHGKTGAKRLMVLVALQHIDPADKEFAAKASAWIASLVDGKPGEVDKAEIRRVRAKLMTRGTLATDNETDSRC